MKTSDEILLFIVKNSKPEYHVFPVSDKKDYLTHSKKKTKREKRDDLLLRLAGSNRYLCESKELEKFLGEEIDFEKHLRPLYENKILYFSGVAENGSFYDSENYRKIFAKSNGQIKNYESGIRHVAFHYKENNFLEDYYNIVKNADELGL